MSLGGRPLRTAKHLCRAFPPKCLLIHHGIVKHIAHSPSVFKQRWPVVDEAYIDSPLLVKEERRLKDLSSVIDTAGDAPGLLTSFEKELLDKDPEHLIAFLNGQSSLALEASPHAVPTADVVSAYLTLRRSPASLSSLHPAAYTRIADHAKTDGLQQVMAVLAEDLLSHFPRESDPEGFSFSVIAILSRATSKCPLSPQSTLRLYEGLVTSNPVKPLPLDPDVVQRIAMASIIRPDALIPPLETLIPPLLLHSQAESTHTKTTQLAYELLMKVLVEGEQSYTRALSLFQELIAAKLIPQVAQARAGEQGGSFPTVITSALVRACLWFQWPIKAAELLTELLRDPQWPHAKGTTETDVHVITGLGLEVLHVLVPSSSRNEIQASRALIMALIPISNDPSNYSSIPHPPPLEIPHEVLFTFYDSCYLCQFVEAAAHVYHHLQSPQVRQYHDYPPPRNAALLWLLDHFASPGISRSEDKRRDLEGRLYIARAMVEDILRRKHPVQPMDRPRLIALVAARGFGLCARQLWELYTAKDDLNRNFVRGNARVLVRIVKLFVAAQQRWDTIPKTCNYKGAHGSRVSKNGVECADESKDNHIAPQSLPRDYLQFAERVLAAFIETKLPLAMASRFDLNALARAQLLLGHLPEGMSTLTLITERAETPGVKDLNVALATLARYSPSHATQMIQYMLDRGVQPSASTFSAVLQEALQDNETKLVVTLVTLAKELGYGALTHKGIAGLLRSAMNFEYTSNQQERLRQQSSVRWAMVAVKTIMDNRSKSASCNEHVKDHALSIRIGIECVKGSLKAMQPQMAFQFWRLLIKDRVLLNDREHVDLRAWIARSIRHQWREKQIGTTKAKNLLTDLGAPGVEADGLQVPNPQRTYITSIDGSASDR